MLLADLSDGAITTIVTGAVTVVMGFIGFLTLWVKLKYGADKAQEAASNAEKAVTKVDQAAEVAATKAKAVEKKIDENAAKTLAVEEKLDQNTEITTRIEQQTNGPLSGKLTQIERRVEEKLGQIQDHADRIGALETKVEAVKVTLDTLSKNVDSTRHEMRGHLQTITNHLQLLTVKGVATVLQEPK